MTRKTIFDYNNKTTKQIESDFISAVSKDKLISITHVFFKKPLVKSGDFSSKREIEENTGMKYILWI